MINARELKRRAELDGVEKTEAHLLEALSEGHLKPEDFSLRDTFKALVVNRDGDMVGSDVLEECCNPQHQNSKLSLAESTGMVNTAAFANITGQIAFNAAMAGYESEEFIFTRKIPTIQTQFSGEKIPGISDLGDQAQIVAEGRPYPLAGVSEDWVETPSTLKRGFIVPVTKEAIFFDRTGILLRQASDLGKSFGLNKEKRAIDCIIDQNTTAARYRWRGTTYATYQTTTPWINKKTSNGLEDWTDIGNAEQLLANMVDPNTGEPINVMADTIIVTPEKESAAMRILDAIGIAYHSGGYVTNASVSQSNGPNPVGRGRYSTKYSVMSSRHLPGRLATDTDWFLGNPAKAFAYMQNWAATYTQAPMNSEEEFNSDIVYRYKVSERGAFATMDPRYMIWNTVA